MGEFSFHRKSCYWHLAFRYQVFLFLSIQENLKYVAPWVLALRMSPFFDIWIFLTYFKSTDHKIWLTNGHNQEQNVYKIFWITCIWMMPSSMPCSFYQPPQINQYPIMNSLWFFSLDRCTETIKTGTIFLYCHFNNVIKRP